jgi:hypothetical protein
MIYHGAVRMNQRIKDLSDRLRLELNQDARTIDFATSFKLLDAMEELTEDVRAELVDAMRGQERSWEWISKLMGRSRQSVWEKYH